MSPSLWAAPSLSVLPWQPRLPVILLPNMEFASSLLSEPQSSCMPPNPRPDRGRGGQVTVETARLWLWEAHGCVGRGSSGQASEPTGLLEAGRV